MAKRQWHEIPWIRFITFTTLMIILQSAGALLFPSRWTGADDPLEIIGVSALCGALYTAFMWIIETWRARKER